MIVSYDNKILDSTLTVNSENPNYPVSNFLNPLSTKFFRSLVDTGVRIVIDRTISADWIFILNHNITSGATIKIEANTSDSWGSPAFSESITWKEDMMFHTFTLASYDYWSLYIDDGSNPDTFIQIGQPFLSAGLVMPPQTLTTNFKTVDTSRRKESPSGTTTTDLRYSYRIGSIEHPAYNQAENVQLKTMFKFMSDYGNPVIMMPWEESTDVQPPMYCYKDQEYDQKKLSQAGVVFSTVHEFKETK